MRLRGSRVTELIDSGDRRALVVQRIQADMDSYLSVVQVGITGATSEEDVRFACKEVLYGLAKPCEMRAI